MKSDKWEDEIFLSLGSNIGEREFYLNSAIELIKREMGEVLSVSSIYETEPWGSSQLNSFLNQVIRVKSQLSPMAFLDKCLEIETKLKRERNKKEGYQNRTIDIDMLFYGKKIISNEMLKVPHPQLVKRAFVLVPLDEIAADFEHPGNHKRIATLLSDLNDIRSVKIVSS